MNPEEKRQLALEVREVLRSYINEEYDGRLGGVMSTFPCEEYTKVLGKGALGMSFSIDGREVTVYVDPRGE